MTTTVTQRRKYKRYFEATLLVHGPIPIIGSLGSIRVQHEYRSEVQAWWMATQNDQVTHKASMRFWKAYRLWHIDTVGPDRLKHKMGAMHSHKFNYSGCVTGRWKANNPLVTQFWRDARCWQKNSNA